MDVRTWVSRSPETGRSDVGAPVESRRPSVFVRVPERAVVGRVDGHAAVSPHRVRLGSCEPLPACRTTSPWVIVPVGSLARRPCRRDGRTELLEVCRAMSPDCPWRCCPSSGRSVGRIGALLEDRQRAVRARNRTSARLVVPNAVPTEWFTTSDSVAEVAVRQRDITVTERVGFWSSPAADAGRVAGAGPRERRDADGVGPVRPRVRGVRPVDVELPEVRPVRAVVEDEVGRAGGRRRGPIEVGGQEPAEARRG